VAKTKQQPKPAVVDDRPARERRREELAAMTAKQREAVCPAGLAGEARRRFIDQGLPLEAQEHAARTAREAEEAMTEQNTENTVTVKEAAKQLSVNKTRVRKIARQLKIATPYTQDDIARIAEHTNANTKEPTMTKPAAKKAAAKTETKETKGVVTVADIAAEAGVDAKAVRKVLRQRGVDKKDGRYEWPSLNNRTVKAVIKAVKA
jgi:phage antirepressor YoqD-like protein